MWYRPLTRPAKARTQLRQVQPRGARCSQHPLVWQQHQGTHRLPSHGLPCLAASSYNVKRATVSSGPYTTIASGVAAPSYSDTTVANGSTYYYVVSAANSCGASPNSTQVSATPQASTPPAAPTGLSATSRGRLKIQLKWTQSSSSGVTQSRIYRSVAAGGPYVPVATIAATTSYSDTSVTADISYYYVVTALSGGGLESAYSNQASDVPR